MGNKYTVVGSRFGDYFVVEGTQLKTYDNDGYIETLKPVPNRRGWKMAPTACPDLTTTHAPEDSPARRGTEMSGFRL